MGGMLRMRTLPAGSRVKVKSPGPVPEWSTWEDDHHRVSTSTKRRLQQLFFRGDRRITASVMYIGTESLRDRLRAKGQLKVELRDPAGSSVVILAAAEGLIAA